MQGTTFILRIEGSFGYWTMRVCGRQVDKFYVPFANIVCA